MVCLHLAVCRNWCGFVNWSWGSVNRRGTVGRRAVSGGLISRRAVSGWAVNRAWGSNGTSWTRSTWIAIFAGGTIVAWFTNWTDRTNWSWTTWIAIFAGSARVARRTGFALRSNRAWASGITVFARGTRITILAGFTVKTGSAFKNNFMLDLYPLKRSIKDCKLPV